MPIEEMQSSILLSETTTFLMSHLPEHLRLKDNLLLVFLRPGVTLHVKKIKIIRNQKTFNKGLKEHFFNQLKETVSCDRLLCLQCHPPDRL
jgi:hypothetical protein